MVTTTEFTRANYMALPEGFATQLIEAGVEEVRIVDPDDEVVEIRTRRGETAFRGPRVAISGVVPGFEAIPDELLGGDER